MKIGEYIEEKIGFIIANITLIVLLGIYLFFFQTPLFLIGSLIITWIITVSIYLILTYYKIKKEYNDIINTVDALQEKYLVSEVIPKPNSSLNKAYYYALRKACKAMNDKITLVTKEKHDYKDYLESFVHEIKTPIASISLYSENNNNLVLQNEIKKIDNLVEQILYFSRSENPEKDYFIKELNLEDIIHDCLLEYKNNILGKKIKITTESLNNHVFCDEKWLKFIINQILQNSIKYVKEKGKLEIKADNNQNNISLIIKDNGIGIRDYDLLKVFEYGFTGSDRKKDHSTGVGLYLAKKLCDKLSLDLKIRSRYGEYTEVELIFPKSNMHHL